MTIFWILFAELETCLFMNVRNPILYESNENIFIVLALSSVKNVKHLMTHIIFIIARITTIDMSKWD